MDKIINKLKSQPNAPKVAQTNYLQVAELNGYWAAIKKHINHVIEMQKEIPNWLPDFNPIF